MKLEKNIPPSEFERIAHSKRNPLSLLLKMPYWLYSRIFLKNLEAFRNPKDALPPIIPESKHNITYQKYELPGKPKPVQIGVFKKTDLNEKKLPLFFFIHGGSFVAGDCQINEGLLRFLADKMDLIAATVDYNVAPEAKHPIPLEDCEAALRFLVKNHPVDTDRIFIAGDSAGGNLAAALVLKLLDCGDITPKGQILLYPVCDFTNLKTESYLQKGAAYEIMKRGMVFSRNVYLADKSVWVHPYASPQYANFDKPQPDALLLIAECDGLREDGLNYGKKLAAAGGKARTILYKGAYHAFINDLYRSPTADDAAAEILAFMNV